MIRWWSYVHGLRAIQLAGCCWSRLVYNVYSSAACCTTARNCHVRQALPFTSLRTSTLLTSTYIYIIYIYIYAQHPIYADDISCASSICTIVLYILCDCVTEVSLSRRMYCANIVDQCDPVGLLLTDDQCVSWRWMAPPQD